MRGGWGAWPRCLVSLSIVLPVFVYLSLSFPCRVELGQSFLTSPTLGYLSIPRKPVPGNSVPFCREFFDLFLTMCVLPRARLNDPVRPVFSVHLVCTAAAFSTAGLALPFLARFKHPVKNKLFATVLGSSINSWDSWFIFNLWKINTCYCMTCFFYMGKKRRLLAWESTRIYIINVNLECWFSSNACNKVEIPLYDNAHVFSNVLTSASFFLRHLANTSFIVPFWASTDSGSVPISWSPR